MSKLSTSLADRINQSPERWRTIAGSNKTELGGYKTTNEYVPGEVTWHTYFQLANAGWEQTLNFQPKPEQNLKHNFRK